MNFKKITSKWGGDEEKLLKSLISNMKQMILNIEASNNNEL